MTRLLIDKIEELAKDVERIHVKMLEPMADPSKDRFSFQSVNLHLRLELEHELNDKTTDIKKLAYDVSTKLKSLSTKIFFREANHFLSLI